MPHAVSQNPRNRTHRDAPLRPHDRPRPWACGKAGKQGRRTHILIAPWPSHVGAAGRAQKRENRAVRGPSGAIQGRSAWSMRGGRTVVRSGGAYGQRLASGGRGRTPVMSRVGARRISGPISRAEAGASGPKSLMQYTPRRPARIVPLACTGAAISNQLVGPREGGGCARSSG
jgi:hypothetical protein